ncbi:MAG: MHS family MFS transporter [Actinomycetaceae bacterium]|nr:MHS family MFS transporter [Actinomycetaceae bacterium]
MTTEKQHVELTESSNDKKIAFATIASTSLEWYDIFIFSLAAALVMDTQYFGPLASDNPQIAAILSFATVGISFIFRPLGAMIAGHFGDKLGRKIMMEATVFLMGISTFLIGLLPNYASWGLLAPIGVVVLRILQGLATGGMWGGAALMAVEHAPAKKRGWYGGFPQLGVPTGMLLAVLVYFIITAIAPDNAAFNSWGWRIPFLLSILIVGVGVWVRRGIEENDTIKQVDAEDESEQVRLPIVEMFKTSWKPLIQGALVFAGNGVAGYMIAGGFVLNYLAKTPYTLNKQVILLIVALTSLSWMATTLLAAWLSDRIGRKKVYLISFVFQAIWVAPMFLLFDKGGQLSQNGGDVSGYILIAVALIVLSFPIGFNYGPQSAMFAEMFPTRIRYSGAALANAVGSIIGGGFAPMIAAALLASSYAKGMSHPSLLVAGYIILFTLIALVATLTLKDRTGAPLHGEDDDLANKQLDETVHANDARHVTSELSGF